MNQGSILAIVVAIAVPIIYAIYLTIKKQNRGNKYQPL
jgi:hypothetical protein